MTLYEQMLNTAAQCGINVIGKEHAAQLMAVVYLYGDESAVYSEKMRTDISHVSNKYGLYGGGIPDSDFIDGVRQYIADIKRQKHPVWLNRFEEQYGVTFPEYREAPPPKWRK